VTWSDQDGVLWKTDLPGPGSSSPIISNGRIFVTAYSGYGVARGGGGDLKSLRRHVVCVDAKTGKLLWDRSFTSTADEAGYSGIGIPNHGYASGTPAADGERVYAFFGTAGVVAYDFEGKELWRAAVSPNPRTHNFGTRSSPVLTKDHVVVQASIECEAIVAYDKKTGAEAWRAPADGYGGWWATPVLVETGDRAELVTSVPGEVWGLNPENGKLRWHAESFSDRNVCPSAVVAGGVVYAIGGRQGGAVAVRLGGRGDVTKSHVIWTGSTGSYVPSPVLHQGHLYWVNDRGIAFCLKAETGAQIYNQRVEGGGSFYASLVVGDGKLYAVSRRNGTFVLEAKPEFRQLALNTLSDDDSNFNASPAISDGRIYLRSDRRLYAIDKGK
jgi:outer membrane protein assembly factor BamB